MHILYCSVSQVPATLLIQLPAIVCGKHQLMAQAFESLPTVWENLMEFWALISFWDNDKTKSI